MRELDLKLVKAVDTHLHADHITGLGALRDRTHCITVMGEQTKADVVSMRVAEGDTLEIEGLQPRRALHARPHRRFLQLPDRRPRLHRRHAADPRHRPHRFPERRPARAIRDRSSTRCCACPTRRWSFRRTTTRATRSPPSARRSGSIRGSRCKSIDEYVDADGQSEPAQSEDDGRGGAGQHAVGLHQEEVARRGWALSAAEAMALVGRPDVALIDLREKSEREKHGVIPGSLHAPYADLQDNIDDGGMLHELRRRPARRSCSIAPSASARRWRCRPRRTRALRRPGTSRAAWTPGRGQGARRADEKAPVIRTASCSARKNCLHFAVADNVLLASFARSE